MRERSRSARFSNPPPHRYAGAGFDRAAPRRRDASWQEARRSDPSTVVMRLSGLEVLVDDAATPGLVFETVHLLGQPLPDDALFLGTRDGAALFAADLGPEPPPSARFAELRSVSPAFTAIEAGLGAYARGLAYWHGRHRFCGACGIATKSCAGGHIRCCSGCGTQHFPRSDPAVIVLVTHDHPIWGARCLLGRSVRFPEGLYSTLAGFVEPGESLEETVRREIFEEAGVEVVDLIYRSSQPWPFPASLMLGFRARTADDELRIDADELADARWFTRRELAHPERLGVHLPNPDSIARHLIEEWLCEGP